ncbi:MAG: hypothetical protein U9R19_04755, partial [Bacteroidota bacterium]|nr:hypothetical protein [Bacteroidota bacterium]
MKNFTLIILLVLFGFETINAQNSGNFWYFSAGSLNWCTPQANGDPLYTAGSMGGGEGYAMVSDANCNMIFYTDGTFVWNANWMIMSNSMSGSPGGSLQGSPSSTQSALIIPKPLSTTSYYIFTADANLGADGISYSRVDMTMNSGLGDIDLAEKNVLLISWATEKLNAVRHSNGVNIWVVCHPFNSANFYSYLVTSTGVIAIPVISSIGSFISGVSANTRGYMKFSQDGSRMVAAIEGMNMYELFDFNSTTGQVMNYIPLTGANYDDCYGVEFSATGQYLYGSERWGNQLRQWDISLPTASAIQASEVIVATLSSYAGKALLLGPDYKIYLARGSHNYVGRINYPDQP